LFFNALVLHATSWPGANLIHVALPYVSTTQQAHVFPSLPSLLMVSTFLADSFGRDVFLRFLLPLFPIDLQCLARAIALPATDVHATERPLHEAPRWPPLTRFLNVGPYSGPWLRSCFPVQLPSFFAFLRYGLFFLPGLGGRGLRFPSPHSRSLFPRFLCFCANCVHKVAFSPGTTKEFYSAFPCGHLFFLNRPVTGILFRGPFLRPDPKIVAHLELDLRPFPVLSTCIYGDLIVPKELIANVLLLFAAGLFRILDPLCLIG